MEKYWKRRMSIQKPGNNLINSYYLLWVRRKESFFGATTGTGQGWKGNKCCQFNEKVTFPHGFCGIVIAQNVVFEGETIVHQHVTISEEDRNKTTIIGKNVMIGAGAVILNNARIGDNVKIGANAVVTHDIPSNCTCVGIPAQVIKKEESV